MEYDWIKRAKAHGWDTILNAALDTLEPFGALGANAIWILQPALGLLVPKEALEAVAHALEEPGGIERLRERLTEE
jgi:hypothetical protein